MFLLIAANWLKITIEDFAISVALKLLHGFCTFLWLIGGTQTRDVIARYNGTQTIRMGNVVQIEILPTRLELLWAFLHKGQFQIRVKCGHIHIRHKASMVEINATRLLMTTKSGQEVISVDEMLGV